MSSVTKVTNFAELQSRFQDPAAARAGLKQFIDSCAGKAVILAGCGGGADCFGAAYLIRSVKAVAAKVAIMNLGFVSVSELSASSREVLPKLLYAVPPGLRLSSKDYFAEARLATALNTEVFSFAGGSCSVGEIAQCHAAVLREMGIDVKNAAAMKNGVVLALIDGGADAFLRGDETGLATPIEDMLHIAGARLVYGECGCPAYLCNIGADVDAGHGMIVSEMIDRIRYLVEQKKALVSAEVLTPLNEEARFYCDVVMLCEPRFTIVQSLAVAAINGFRGLYTPPHLVSRIGANRVPLTSETATFFVWNLWSIDIGYLDALQPTDRASQLQRHIAEYRSAVASKKLKEYEAAHDAAKKSKAAAAAAAQKQLEEEEAADIR